MNGYNIYLRVKGFVMEVLKWAVFGGIVFFANLLADYYYFGNVAQLSYYAVCQPYPNGSLQCKIMSEGDRELHFTDQGGPIIPRQSPPPPKPDEGLET